MATTEGIERGPVYDIDRGFQTADELIRFLLTDRLFGPGNIFFFELARSERANLSRAGRQELVPPPERTSES